MAVAQGRCSARPSSTAARQRARPASSRPRDGSEQGRERRRPRGRGRRRRRVTPRGRRRPRATNGAVSSRRTSRRQDLGGPVPDGRVGEDVGRLVADLGRQVRHACVLGAQDVVAEQSLERRRRRRSCRARAGRRGRRRDCRAPATLRTVGTAAASSRARRARTASTPRCSRSRPRAGCTPAREASVVGVRGEPGQQHVGHQPTRGEPDEVESQGGGTDQGVRHSALPPGKRSGRDAATSSPMLTAPCRGRIGRSAALTPSQDVRRGFRVAQRYRVSAR